MKIDFVSKILLSVIASCLVWTIFLGSASKQTTFAHSDQEPTSNNQSSIKAPFRVVDDQGKILLEVKRQNGYVNLTLLDGEKELVDIFGSSDGSSIRLSDPNEKGASVFIHASRESRMIILHGKETNNRFQLTNNNDSDTLSMKGAKGNSIFAYTAADGGSINMNTTSGGYIFSSQRGKTELFLNGPNGKPGLILESNAGVSSVNVYSPFKDRGFASLYNNIGGPKLKFTDGKDSPIFELPTR